MKTTANQHNKERIHIFVIFLILKNDTFCRKRNAQLALGRHRTFSFIGEKLHLIRIIAQQIAKPTKSTHTHKDDSGKGGRSEAHETSVSTLPEAVRSQWVQAADALLATDHQQIQFESVNLIW